MKYSEYMTKCINISGGFSTFKSIVYLNNVVLQ